MKYIKEYWFIYCIVLLLVFCMFMLSVAIRKDNEHSSNKARCESLKGIYASPSGDCWKDGERI